MLSGLRALALVAVVMLARPIPAAGVECPLNPFQSSGAFGFSPAPWRPDAPSFNLRTACVGKAYDQNLIVGVPSELTLSGFSLPVTNFSLPTSGGVTGLPLGMTYTCDPPNCVWNKNAYFTCIKLSGTPTGPVGTYDLKLPFTVASSFGAFPVEYPKGFDQDAHLYLKLEAACPTATRNDVDGDDKADVAVYDAVTGNWQAVGSTVGSKGLPGFGGPGFKPVPGDFDGDGITDPGIYEVATGIFTTSVAGVPAARVMFLPPDVPADWLPAPADYDGDGKTDFANYNQVTGVWFIRHSSTMGIVYPDDGDKLGGTGFLAAPADFDGDGLADPAVYKIDNGAWSYRASKTDSLQSLPTFGGGGRFVPVPADYDGDGKADQALYQKKKGKWRFRFSSTGATSSFTGIGGTGWEATPGDFDGDGKVDAAAYRKSTGAWRYHSSLTGLTTTLPTLGGTGLSAVVGMRPR